MQKFQFRLIRLLLLTTIVCCIFAIIAWHHSRNREIEQLILDLQSKGAILVLENGGNVYVMGKSRVSDVTNINLSLANPEYAQLEKIHWVESLRSLNLTDTKADDKILNSLQGMKNLETVVVFNSKISQSAIDAFSKQRPGILILNTENTIDGLRAILK